MLIYEKIDNPKIQHLIRNIPDSISLKKTEDMLVTKKDLWRVLSEFRKFHMIKFFDYCKEVELVA